MDTRRDFLRQALTVAALGAGASACPSALGAAPQNAGLFFDISLAQWSLHRQLRAGALKFLDFPARAREVFDISAVEYVTTFFMDKAEDRPFLAELKRRADDNGVRNLLIMVDGEGDLGDVNPGARQRALENHYKWVAAASYLGCHSIRVNAVSEGSAEDVQQAAIDGLTRLTDFAAGHGIGIIIENRWGHSGNGRWLAELVRKVDLPGFGTLPDFGNWVDYDRYQGVEDLMPYAKGVSAKSYAFDEAGNETTIDFARMLSIVKGAGFAGYIGIEYEGPGDEEEGIKATRDLLTKLGKELSWRQRERP